MKKHHIEEYNALCLCLNKMELFIPFDIKRLLFDYITPRFSQTITDVNKMREIINFTIAEIHIPQLKEECRVIPYHYFINLILGDFTLEIKQKEYVLFDNKINLENRSLYYNDPDHNEKQNFNDVNFGEQTHDVFVPLVPKKLCEIISTYLDVFSKEPIVMKILWQPKPLQRRFFDVSAKVKFILNTPKQKHK